jgi:hypothetical protein
MLGGESAALEAEYGSGIMENTNAATTIAMRNARQNLRLCMNPIRQCQAG